MVTVDMAAGYTFIRTSPPILTLAIPDAELVGSYDSVDCQKQIVFGSMLIS